MFLKNRAKSGQKDASNSAKEQHFSSSESAERQQMAGFGRLYKFLRMGCGFSTLFIAAGILTAVTGCSSVAGGIASSSSATPAITLVVLGCSPTSIDANQTSACAAAVNGTGSFSSALNWSVAPAGMGSVSSAGVFTPAAAGTATITAASTEDATKSASATVTVAVANPVPAIAALSPASLALEATPQALTISGTGFLPSSTVTLNGRSHAATFVNAGQLAVFLTSADLAASGSFPVVVTNPAPGGGASTAENFTVTNWQPADQIIPLYPHTWGFFAGVSTVAPSGVAVWPGNQGQLNVTGAAGSGTLTLNGMTVVGSGGIDDYCTTANWGAMIQHDDGSYGTYTVSSCNSGAVNIYPTLAKSVTNQSLWNIWDFVNGQHLTAVGYMGLATWLYNLKAYQGYIAEVADGRYFDASGNGYGTDVVRIGGLGQNGVVPGTSIIQGVFEPPVYPSQLTTPLSGAVASQDPNATFVIGEPNRIKVGGGTAGQGVTHSANLGGKSGYFHAFIGVGGQYNTTLPSRLTVSVVVDGKTLYNNASIAGMTEITVPFTNGQAGTLSVTLNSSSPTAFDISDLAWYVWPPELDAQMQEPLILPSSSGVVDSDSWGTMHGGGFATPLEALLVSNPEGPFTEFENISLGGTSAIWAISNYATAVQPIHPDYAIFDYQINDINGVVITQYAITNGGSYSSPPAVTISGCAPGSATAAAILTGSAVTALAFGATGLDCYSQPTVTFSPPGATATVVAAPVTPVQLVNNIETLAGLATASGTTPIYLRSLETNSLGQAVLIDRAEEQFNTLSTKLAP
jgi:hypothetical protein